MSKNNFDQHLNELFSQFEPEVPVPGFKRLDRDLNQIQAQHRLVKQTKSARRFAAATAAIALGVLGYVSVENVNVQDESLVGKSLPSVEAAVERIEVSDVPAVARTTNSVRIEAPSDLLVASEASSDGREVKEIQEEGAQQASSSPTRLDPDIAAAANPNANERHNPSAEEFEATVSSASAERSSQPTVSESTHNEENSAAIGVTSSVQEACEGTEVSFSLATTDIDGSVLWNFGDGNFSSEASPTHVFHHPGTYDITISLRSRDNGVIRTRTVENMIVVRPKPEAQLNWSAALAKDDDALALELVDETEGASSTTWIVDGTLWERGNTFIHASGEHRVNLVVSNAYGCQDSEERTMEIHDRREAKAPALFSPDGDGRYDEFLPAIVHDLGRGTNWHLEVMDESGETVFTTSDVTRPWKGEMVANGRGRSGAHFRWLLTVQEPHRKPTYYFDEVKIER